MDNPKDEQSSDAPDDPAMRARDGALAPKDFGDLAQRLDRLWPATHSLSSSYSDPYVGRRIAHYDLVRVLGSGAFGVVYLAKDTRLDREVALKLPRPEVLIDEEKCQRFAAEAAMAARLDHHGIVPIYHAELKGPAPYIASGFCDGPDLAEWFEQQGQPVGWQDAAELVAQAAEAIHYAHSQGVYHRDLKPANILLSPKSEAAADQPNLSNYEPRIADFGLSKLADASLTDTRSSLLIGTPLYMAPEQIDRSIGRGSEAATDIYSLGVILFELLTGRPPIEGESYVEVLDSIRTDKATPLRSLRRDVPRDLERICSQCLEKNPEARYQSADALASDLRRCLRGEPIQDTRQGSLARLAYWSRRPARIAEAGWFTVWVQGVWVIWVLGTDVFIHFSNVILEPEDFLQILSDTCFIFLTVHAPLAYFGWKTIQGACWGPWASAILTAAMMPGLFASIATGPVFFAPVYKDSTTWFVWAVYFMLITCFTIQIAYNGCAIAAVRQRKRLEYAP